MSKKSDLIQKIVKDIELPHELPSDDFEGNLLEAGMYTALLRELPSKRAASAVANLRKAYDDYNETRVSQLQEIAGIIAPKGKGLHRLDKYLPAAKALKAFLQAVFQETHGLDLEGLKDDPVGIGRAISSVPSLGNALASYLLFRAEEGQMPILSGAVRVMDRLGVMTRTSSVRKAREALAKVIAPKERLGAAYALGIVVDNWCDSRKPTCWECALLKQCTFGQKVEKDWVAQQERLAKQREKEDARAAALAEKEDARLARETERENRLRAATLKKITKEREKAARVTAKKAEIEKKRKDAERKKAAEKKKAADRKVAERKKAVADKKKAAAQAKKDAAAKKREAKKASAKKTAAKKPTTKKPTTKKPTTKKPTAKKPTAKKPVAKKAATKKPAATKSVAKKSKSSAPKKKVAAKKVPAKKAAKKKAPVKKKVAKKAPKKAAKKASKKTTPRRK